MKRRISLSMLSADFKILGEQLAEAETCGCEWLHIDVMDGIFVPSMSFGQPVVRSVREGTNMFFDAHLMVQKPCRYFEDFKKAGAELITIHAESDNHLDRSLQQIKDLGIKVGVALNPATPICVLENILHKIDLVLIMSVNPGYGGQVFIENSLNKIRRTREMLDAAGRQDCLLEVDGGINEHNIEKVIRAGADTVVVGSSMFNGNLKERFELLNGLCQNA